MFSYSMTDNFKVVQTQHGYKNQSFHTGKIEIASHELNYIYDCGLNKKELEQYFRQNNTPVDLVFISHFDMDHVRGIIELKKTTEFGHLFRKTQFFIPLVNNVRYQGWIKFLPVIVDINNSFRQRYPKYSDNSSLYQDFAEFITSKNVHFVIEDNYDTPRFDRNSTFNLYRKEYSGDSSTPLILPQYRSQHLNWMFLSKVCANDEILAKVDEYIEDAVKNNPDFDEHIQKYEKDNSLESTVILIEDLQNILKGKQIKMGDGSDSKIGNLISMIMYSGPIVTSNNQLSLIHEYSEYSRSTNKFSELFFIKSLEYLRYNHRFMEYCRLDTLFNDIYLSEISDKVGWIHTGDANMKDIETYENFEKYFHNVFDNTGIMTLPHHGSKNSYNTKLTQGLDDTYFIVTKFKSAKIDANLEKKLLDKENKNFVMLDGNKNFELETISNNIGFKGIVSQKYRNNDSFFNFDGILKFEYIGNREDTSEIIEINNEYRTYSSKSPKQLNKNKLIFLTLINPSANESPIIIGRAKTHGFMESNEASVDDIKKYALGNFRYYVDLYDVEVLGGKIQDCIQLYDVIEHFWKDGNGINMFTNSTAKTPYEAYKQQSYRGIINEAKIYINSLLDNDSRLHKLDNNEDAIDNE